MNVKRIVYSGILIAIGVLLPIVFHFIPGNFGLFALPIHYSAYLGGGFLGPIIGAIVGFFTPILSHLLTGMPINPIFIIISFETLTYGLIFGLLYYHKRFNIYLSLGISMVIGRFVNFTGTYIIANLFLGYASKAFQLTNILYNYTIGLVGASIQFIILPIIIKRINLVYSFNKSEGYDV